MSSLGSRDGVNRDEFVAVPTEDTPTASPIGRPEELGEEEEVTKEEPAAPSETPGPDSRTVLFGIVLYAACSSTLLLINKVAMHLVPDASFILFCQFVSSSVF